MNDTLDTDEYVKDFFKFYNMITKIYHKLEDLEYDNTSLKKYHEFNENRKKFHEGEILSLKREINELKQKLSEKK